MSGRNVKRIVEKDKSLRLISIFEGVFVYLDTSLIPPPGGEACVVQRTLPRKKPDAIDRMILFSAPMASVFLTPLPIRKVCPDAILLRANRGIKPLVSLSFMDYFFMMISAEFFLVCFAGVTSSPSPSSTPLTASLLP
jgi:hypothetical protein